MPGPRRIDDHVEPGRVGQPPHHLVRVDDHVGGPADQALEEVPARRQLRHGHAGEGDLDVHGRDVTGRNPYGPSVRNTHEGEPNGTLYVADTVHSRIAAVPFATSRFFPVLGGGFTVSQGGSLNAPLGLATAPNGNLITVNGNDGNAVELTPRGAQVDTRTIDRFDSGGDLFGLAIAPGGRGLLFVNDNGAANTLDLLH